MRRSFPAVSVALPTSRLFVSHQVLPWAFPASECSLSQFVSVCGVVVTGKVGFPWCRWWESNPHSQKLDLRSLPIELHLHSAGLSRPSIRCGWGFAPHMKPYALRHLTALRSSRVAFVLESTCSSTASAGLSQLSVPGQKESKLSMAVHGRGRSRTCSLGSQGPLPYRLATHPHGAGNGIRTHDLLITGQPLFRLSYPGTWQRFEKQPLPFFIHRFPSALLQTRGVGQGWSCPSRPLLTANCSDHVSVFPDSQTMSVKMRG